MLTDNEKRRIEFMEKEIEYCLVAMRCTSRKYCIMENYISIITLLQKILEIEIGSLDIKMTESEGEEAQFRGLKDYIAIKNVVKKIKLICFKHKYCSEGCIFWNPDTGVCVFNSDPERWDTEYLTKK